MPEFFTSLYCCFRGEKKGEERGDVKSICIRRRGILLGQSVLTPADPFVPSEEGSSALRANIEKRKKKKKPEKRNQRPKNPRGRNRMKSPARSGMRLRVRSSFGDLFDWKKEKEGERKKKKPMSGPTMVPGKKGKGTAAVPPYNVRKSIGGGVEAAKVIKEKRRRESTTHHILDMREKEGGEKEVLPPHGKGACRRSSLAKKRTCSNAKKKRKGNRTMLIQGC